MTWEFDERFYRKLHQHASEFWGEDVESPIEMIFLTAFHFVNDHHPASIRWEVLPQSEMHCGEGVVHRVDFELISDGRDQVAVVVECDGRDFHHASWEQIKRDRERDRQIEKVFKCKVFRFPGTEIFNDPVGCATTVIDYACTYQINAFRRRKERRDRRRGKKDAAA